MQLKTAVKFAISPTWNRRSNRWPGRFAESGDYRLTRRLEPQTEYHPPDNNPKLVAAVADVETTAPTRIATRLSNSASASSNMTVRTGGYTKFSVHGSGSKIPAFRSRLRSRTLPALPIRWSP